MKKPSPLAEDSHKQSLSRLQTKSQDYENEIARQQLKIIELETTLGHLHKEITKQQGLKQQLKRLYRNLDNSIMHTINTRGYARKQSQQMAKFPIIDQNLQDKKELRKIARIYDVEQNFHYLPGKEHMKLHYRVIGKAYRQTRELAEKGFIKSYQLTKRTSR